MACMKWHLRRCDDAKEELKISGELARECAESPPWVTVRDGGTEDESICQACGTDRDTRRRLVDGGEGMDELDDYELSIVELEAEYARAVSTAIFYKAEAENSVFISDLTARLLREKAQTVRETLSSAARQREEYEQRCCGAVLVV